MKTTGSFLRFAALVGLGSCVVLVLASQAFSAVSPKLFVTTGSKPGATTVTITATVMNPGDDPIGELQIYVPSGYSFKQAPTTGKATVTVVDPDIDSTTPLTLPGSVAPVSPSDSRVSTTATNCDASTHQAAWLVTGQNDRLTYTFPLFLDQTAGNETNLGSYKLVACLPAPTSAGPSASRKFYGMTIQLAGLGLPSTSGTFVWRSLWTPFAPSSSTLNASGNVEAQSTEVAAPVSLTISSMKVVKAAHGARRVTLTGTLLVGGKPVPNVIVALSHAPLANGRLTSLARVTTNAAGTWTKTITLPASTFVTAGATIPSKPAQCQASFGVPCLLSTGGSMTVASRLLHLRR